MTEELPQNCGTCRFKKAIREQWGCDYESPTPVGWINCPRCFGRDPECFRCDGVLRVPIYRCPNQTLPPNVIRFLSLYANQEQGFLPEGGGLLDQANTFVEASNLIRSEIESFKSRKIKEAEKKGG